MISTPFFPLLAIGLSFPRNRNKRQKIGKWSSLAAGWLDPAISVSQIGYRNRAASIKKRPGEERLEKGMYSIGPKIGRGRSCVLDPGYGFAPKPLVDTHIGGRRRSNPQAKKKPGAWSRPGLGSCCQSPGDEA